MKSSKKIVVVLLSVVIVFGLSFTFIPAALSESVLLPSFGGFFYVSEIQGNNDNTSYSVMFHDVNFTFLYWLWPVFDVIGNVTYYGAEQPVDVIVQVTFPDNITEQLLLVVDSPGSCLIGVSSELHGVTSTQSYPRVGIATAETQELHCSWVYLVSFF